MAAEFLIYQTFLTLLILGRIIIQSDEQRTIDVSALGQGTYLMQVYQNGEIQKIKKLIVIRN